MNHLLWIIMLVIGQCNIPIKVALRTISGVLMVQIMVAIVMAVAIGLPLVQTITHSQPRKELAEVQDLCVWATSTEAGAHTEVSLIMSDKPEVNLIFWLYTNLHSTKISNYQEATALIEAVVITSSFYPSNLGLMGLLIDSSRIILSNKSSYFRNYIIIGADIFVYSSSQAIEHQYTCCIAIRQVNYFNESKQRYLLL